MDDCEQGHYCENYYFSGRYPIFSGGYRNYDSFEVRHPYDWIVKLLPSTKNKEQVLDVGCATGAFLSHLPNKYKKVGVDISEYAIERGKELHPTLELFNCNILNFDYPSQFDVITALDCLEHTKNVGFVLDKIYDLLEDEGTFIFIVPIASKIHSFFASFGLSLLTCDISHIVLTTKDSWKNYILGEKWEIVLERKLTSGRFYVPPFHLLHLFLVKKKKKGGKHKEWLKKN